MMKLARIGIVAAALAALLLSGIGDGAAAAGRGFSLASVKGAYAGIFSGQANTGESLIPLLGTGVFISNGKGNLSGHETYTIGTMVCDAQISGTYTVDPDGTGAASIAFSTLTPGCTGGSYTQSLAIADGGKTILLSNTNGDQINEQWHTEK
ncbi:MAG: hypothetical protein ACREQI_11590 [Candidatus Binataceae bacterium]